MKKYIAGKVIKKGVSDLKKSVKGQTKRGRYRNIEWNNYNFPPFLNLIHFDMLELEEPEKSHI